MAAWSSAVASIGFFAFITSMVLAIVVSSGYDNIVTTASTRLNAFLPPFLSEPTDRALETSEKNFVDEVSTAHLDDSATGDQEEDEDESKEPEPAPPEPPEPPDLPSSSSSSSSCFSPLPILTIVSNTTVELSRRSKLCTAPHEMGLRSTKCKKTVALSSWEGSGNHFARYLMEQSSRIMTGSKFGDYSQWMLLGAKLSKAHAPAGLNALDRNGRTVATKTHLGPDGDTLGKGIKPGPAIVIVRDPRGAILANYNRIGSFLPTGYQDLKGRRKRAVKAKAALMSKKRSGAEGSSHLSVVDDWGKFTRERHFDAYLRSEAASWRRDVGSWLADRRWSPTLFVKYEDLKKSTKATTLKMLNFAGIPTSNVDPERLACVASRSNATARKVSSASSGGGGGKSGSGGSGGGKYNPWTPQRQRAVWSIAGAVMKRLGYGQFYTPS